MKTGEFRPYTDKVRSLLLTPFQTTLFLDSDTHVRGDIRHLRYSLGEHSIAVTDAPWCDMAMSSGVILYDRTRAALLISESIERMCAAIQSDLGFFEDTRVSFGDMDFFNQVATETRHRDLVKLLPSLIYNCAHTQIWSAIDDGRISESLIIHTHYWDKLNQFVPVTPSLSKSIDELQIFINNVIAEAGEHITAGNDLQVLAQLPIAARYFPYVHFLIMAAECFWRMGDLENAYSFFARAIEVEPKGPYCHNRMADFLLVTGRLDEAVAAARKAVQIAPKYELSRAAAELLTTHQDVQ